MTNRFNPFVAMRQPLLQQRPAAVLQPVPQAPQAPRVVSAISRLPAYAQRLIFAAWNDRNALGLLRAMWNSAIGDVLRDTRQRDPNTIARMLQVSNEISQRIAALPIIEGDTYNERGSDWDDYAF